MELLYLWTSKYGVFENNGFNFGGKYLYDYDYQKKSLNISENKNYIEDFFNNDDDSHANGSNTKIENITAIVGQNGTGKTTLIELLQKYFVKQNNFHHTEHFAILVFRHNNEFIIISSNPYLRDLRDPLKIVKKSENIEEHTLSNNNNNSYLPCEEYSTIYYSPVVDGQYYGDEESNGDFPDFYDISTNYLMFRNDKDWTTNEQMGEDIHGLSYPHWYHINNENYRIIRFLSNDAYRIDLQKRFKLPEITKISLCPRIHKADVLLALIKRAPLDERTNEELKLLKEKIDASTDNAERFKLLIYLNFAYCYANIHKKMDISLEQFTGKSCKEENLKFKEFSDKINALLENLLSQQHTFIDNRLIVTINNDSGVKIIEKLADIFYKFKYYYTIELRLPNRSSGEISWFKLYSRFWDLIKCPRASNCQLNSNIFILIDEGEIYMHPEWQKQFTFRIMAMCQSFFPGKRIQIIFATNNPLLLSDLPTHNIIFLDKDENQKITVRQIKEQQTFGASVTKILADSFFLQGGMIGAFAKEKINKLINDLRPVEISNTAIAPKQQDKRILYKTIALLGEPIMRRHLEQKLHEIDTMSLDERISRLENEIADLKRQKANMTTEES